MGISSIVLLITVLVIGSQEATEPGAVSFQKPSEPVFVVTVNKYAQGFKDDKPTSQFGDLLLIGLVDQSQPAEDAPSHGDENAPSYYYATTYFRPGARFKVFQGGAPAGTAIVTGIVEFQCDSRAGKARLEGSKAFGREDYALATNGNQVRPHGSRQRKATTGEEKLAVTLANRLYAQAGLPTFTTEQIQVRRLIYTSVDDSRQGLLAGTFYVRTKSAGYQLFAVFGGNGDDWKVQFSRFNKVKDLEDAMDSQAELFVDQLDLDGDAIDELITEVTYYESEDFRILKKFGEQWREVYKGGSGGC